MDANLVVSISAVAVAVIALATTIWQGAVTRQHNKLSVKPHLVIDHVQYDGVTDKLILRNNGLGPAIIVNLTANRTPNLVKPGANRTPSAPGKAGRRLEVKALCLVRASNPPGPRVMSHCS